MTGKLWGSFLGMIAIFVIWIVLAVAFVMTVDVPSATGQEQLPEQSAFVTACTTATQMGQITGVNVSRCRKVAAVEEGNLAYVTVKVWVVGEGTFLIRLAYQKSVWNQTAIYVTPG